jgi:hypothetical protein
MTGRFPRLPPPAKIKKKGNVTAAAETFALSILIIFKPWDLTLKRPKGNLDWYSFCDFVKELAKPDAGYINRAKLQVILNMSLGLKQDAKSKRIMTEYRFRNVKTWEELRKIKGAASVPDAAEFGIQDNSYSAAFDGNVDDISTMEKLEKLARALFQGQPTIDNTTKGKGKLDTTVYCKHTLAQINSIFFPAGDYPSGILAKYLPNGQPSIYCIDDNNSKQSIELDEIQ